MKYEIVQGPAYSLLKVELRSGESITAEAGAMVLFKGDLEIKTHTGGITKAILRKIFGGETFFLNTYIAKGYAEVWFAPGVPGDIAYIPLNGKSIVVQDSSYLAHHGDVDISVTWRGLRGLLAEGELIWLKLEGYGGVWVNSYGGLIELKLSPGEKVTIDNFHFVAMDGDMKWRIRKFGGWKSFFFGGEGFVVEIEGPGTVLLQTRILMALARALKRYLPSGESSGHLPGRGFRISFDI
ncbi:MAG: TIGR00266 family protein [Thermoprotei archaeon]|nr:MAG: TIGR00266 family protein [Thermoprotei archaeon]RLF19016.1 MAG: TIGR00266 family protein [Thermoprotei archaeon]